MRLLLLAALSLYACNGDDDDDDNPMTDSGPGVDGCFDTPSNADAGVTVRCNPSNGTGCQADTDRFCVWNYSADEGECRCLGDAPKAVGESCSLAARDCAAGLVCIQIDSNGPSCHPVCAQVVAGGCDPLSSAEKLYQCFPLGLPDSTSTQNYGVCVGFSRCDPLADTCAADQTCTPITRMFETGCVTAGAIPIGGDCTNDECVKGGICATLSDPNGNPLGINCYEPCDLVTPACTAGSCMNVGVDTFGLCI